MSTQHSVQRSDQERQAVVAELAEMGRECSTVTVLLHNAFAAKIGLNASDTKTLEFLSRLGRVTAGEIARRTGLTTASVTSLVDRLESRGFVRRVPDPDDRRRIFIEPVPEGLAELAPVFAPLTELTEDLFAGYTDEQLETIRGFMQRFLTQADKHLNLKLRS